MAPLKHLSVGQRVTAQARFPRLQKRGPIEATISTPSVRGSAGGFHAYKSVAPLKLCADEQRKRVCVAFPRLQKRGPIEATHARRARDNVAGFHAYKSVAPLKPSSVRINEFRYLCFHAYKSVAPLKRDLGPRPVLLRPHVSTLTKAWPH